MFERGLELLLKKTMGLDAAAVGSAAIAQAVHERMLACAMTDIGAYYERARYVQSELQAFIEAAVIPETWFFRQRAAFPEAARTVASRQRSEPAVVRLLSLACSSGEEPYSIVMALLDASVPSSRFTIDAVDISLRLIALGRHGVYGPNSFRGQDLCFREQHFDRTLLGHSVRERIRAPVTFSAANIFAPNFLVGCGVYDVIFCRNLLIYFDRPTQDRAVSILRKLLAPGGTLFVGSAEAALMLAHGFVWSKERLAFCFREDQVQSARPVSRAAGPVRDSERPQRRAGHVS